MPDASAEAEKQAELKKDAAILKVHLKYFNSEQIDHLERVRDLVFALRSFNHISRDDVVDALSSSEPSQVDIRKECKVVESVDDDSVDVLLMTQEMFFIYPDYDAHVCEFKKAWDQWKAIDKRSDPGRYAPTREHISLFADYLMECYIRDDLILGIVCATNPSVITKQGVLGTLRTS